MTGRHPVLITGGAGYIRNGALWVGLCHKKENNFYNILSRKNPTRENTKRSHFQLKYEVVFFTYNQKRMIKLLNT